MTKADLVEQVYEAIGPGVTKKDCAAVVDAFLNAVKRALANDEHIEIRGFGTFKVRRRKPRMARNPRTGEAVQVLLWKLAWQYRKLAEAKKLLLNGKRRFEVTSQLQITYFADEFLRLVDGHSLEELVGKHGEILKADVALKTSGGHEAAILEALVCRLASGRAT